MNKKTLMIIIAVLVVLAIGVGIYFATRPKTETKAAKETLIIATEGNWSPWTYHDVNGVLTGFDIEVGTKIAEGLGLKPDFQEVPWESILAGVETGTFDIACNGVGYTEERAQKFLFTDPYVYTEAVLVVRKDNNDIEKLEDLKGKKTSNSPNSTYAMRAEAIGATVVYVDTLGETMMMVEDGRVDATINAKSSVEDYLKEHPNARIKIVQTVAGEPVCYPIQKTAENEELLKKINGILDGMRQDGTLAALSKKYFGEDLTKAE